MGTWRSLCPSHRRECRGVAQVPAAIDAASPEGTRFASRGARPARLLRRDLTAPRGPAPARAGARRPRPTRRGAPPDGTRMHSGREARPRRSFGQRANAPARASASDPARNVPSGVISSTGGTAQGTRPYRRTTYVRFADTGGSKPRGSLGGSPGPSPTCHRAVTATPRRATAHVGAAGRAPRPPLADVYLPACLRNDRAVRGIRRPRRHLQAAAAAPARDPALGRPAPTRDQLPAGYAAFFAELSARFRAAQLKAAVAVNRELIALYWDLGRDIVARQEREGWGAGVIARLSADLRREFPSTHGFGAECPERPRVLPGLRARPRKSATACCRNGRGPAGGGGRDPGGHNLLLLEKLDDPALRLWYAERTTAYSESRSVLALPIGTALHTRLGRAEVDAQRRRNAPTATTNRRRYVERTARRLERVLNRPTVLVTSMRRPCARGTLARPPRIPART